MTCPICKAWNDCNCFQQKYEKLVTRINDVANECLKDANTLYEGRYFNDSDRKRREAEKFKRLLEE